MPRTRIDVAALRPLVEQGMPSREIATRLGLRQKQVENAIFVHSLKRPNAKTSPPEFTQKASPDAIDLTSLSGRIVTLEQLLELAQVDRTRWQVSTWTANKWEMGSTHPTTGAILVEPLVQIKAKLVPADPVTRLAPVVKTEVLAEIRAAADRSPVRKVTHQGGAVLGVISPFDLHVGKLAWGDETGGSHYDLKTAQTVLEAALEHTLERIAVERPKLIAYVVGNDLAHYDNLEGTTTGGTLQDRDSRFAAMFRIAHTLKAWALRRCAEVAPTVAIVVPGNHDRQTAWTLGEVLAARFDGHPQIRVDNTPTLRKYLRFGTNLVGFTHGSDEKQADLPLIMAQEQPDGWAETTHREWLTGHYHKMKETRFTAGDSFNGVRVRVLPSLCATDAWHYQKGYVGNLRALESYLYHEATGYLGHLSYTVQVP